MTLDDFLTLTLPERIKWVHSENGPHGKLSHDRFGEILGTSRQTLIDWEKPGGAEPGPKLRKELEKFSGFPAKAFSRRQAEVLVEVTVGHRLRALSTEVSWLRSQLARAFDALDLELDVQDEEQPAQSAGALP